jgi:hypothetical protein
MDLVASAGGFIDRWASSSLNRLFHLRLSTMPKHVPAFDFRDLDLLLDQLKPLTHHGFIHNRGGADKMSQSLLHISGRVRPLSGGATGACSQCWVALKKIEEEW